MFCSGVLTYLTHFLPFCVWNPNQYSIFWTNSAEFIQVSLYFKIFATNPSFRKLRQEFTEACFLPRWSRVYKPSSVPGADCSSKIQWGGFKLFTVHYKSLTSTPRPYLGQGSIPALQEYLEISTELSLVPAEK